MNTTLSTAPGRQDHPPQLERYDRTHFVRRVGVLDRLALHLGVALIKWGRRPLAAESRERRANRVEQQLARVARERATERAVRLTVPLR
jgi:hypothetical protein